MKRDSMAVGLAGLAMWLLGERIHHGDMEKGGRVRSIRMRSHTFLRFAQDGPLDQICVIFLSQVESRRNRYVSSSRRHHMPVATK